MSSRRSPFLRLVEGAALALGVVAAITTGTAAVTLNPSASKAYVDRQISDLRTEIQEGGVFTSTLQVVNNIYTNTTVYNTNYNYDVTYKTNVFVDVNTVTNEFVYNTYTNTYQTNNHYAVYNVTTNFVQRNFVTNYYYNVTTKTNVTVEVHDTTNINTYVDITTNVNEYITNVVNIVTNNPVFPNPVSYTNVVAPVFGYTGVVITVSRWENDIPAAYATNAVSLAPRAGSANVFTNSAYTISLMHGLSPLTNKDGWWYAAYSNDVYQSYMSPALESSVYEDPSMNLDLRTSYEGGSWATAESMTLLYAANMFVDHAFILRRAGVLSRDAEERVVSYNETMAAGYSDEARRLVSDGGLQWLDPTGVWWEVSSEYPVKTYRLFERLLWPDPDTRAYPDEEARFTNQTSCLVYRSSFDTDRYNWRWMAWDYDSGRYFEWSGMDAAQDYHGMPPVAHLICQQDGNGYNAYACTAYTNGVVGTNAVRRAVFDDDLDKVEALTAFDGKSVSTNMNGELEIKGFQNADDNAIPVKSAWNGEIEWTAVSQISAEIAQSVAKNATWGFYDGTLYNCYVQVGRMVYAAGTGGSSTISAASLQDGMYGVGVAYTGSGYSVTFGRMATMSSDPSYDAVVFVGTLSTQSGTKAWSGVASIPIIMVFE